MATLYSCVPIKAQRESIFSCSILACSPDLFSHQWSHVMKVKTNCTCPATFSSEQYVHMHVYIRRQYDIRSDEQAETRFDELTHINNSPRAPCWPRRILTRWSGRVWPGDASPARGAPGGWGLLSHEDTKEMTSVGGLTHKSSGEK